MAERISIRLLRCLLHLCAGEGSGTPLQYSCLENPMDGGAWWAAVHGVSKCWTWLSDFTFTFHFHALEKEMATHSSVLAWRIPGTEEPCRLPSMGSQSRTWLKWLSSNSTPMCIPCKILSSGVWVGLISSDKPFEKKVQKKSKKAEASVGLYLFVVLNFDVQMLYNCNHVTCKILRYFSYSAQFPQIHISCCINSLFLFIPEYYSMICM